MTYLEIKSVFMIHSVIPEFPFITKPLRKACSLNQQRFAFRTDIYFCEREICFGAFRTYSRIATQVYTKFL